MRIEDHEIAKQIAKVLRLKAGDEILLLDGDGFEYTTKLIKISTKEIVGEIMHRQINGNEPQLKITLYQALLKKDNIEWAFQKCTEVGVAAFAPIVTARSEKTKMHQERVAKIVREAAEQSGRGIVPEMGEPQELQSAITKVCRMDMPSIILHDEGDPIRNIGRGNQLYALNMFVGPEGGWSEEELAEFRRREKDGYPMHLVSLGARTLRAETAGVVAAGILLARG